MILEVSYTNNLLSINLQRVKIKFDASFSDSLSVNRNLDGSVYFDFKTVTFKTWGVSLFSLDLLYLELMNVMEPHSRKSEL